MQLATRCVISQGLVSRKRCRKPACVARKGTPTLAPRHGAPVQPRTVQRCKKSAQWDDATHTSVDSMTSTTQLALDVWGNVARLRKRSAQMVFPLEEDGTVRIIDPSALRHDVAFRSVWINIWLRWLPCCHHNALACPCRATSSRLRSCWYGCLSA
jgi:hypothetical protein